MEDKNVAFVAPDVEDLRVGRVCECRMECVDGFFW